MACFHLKWKNKIHFIKRLDNLKCIFFKSHNVVNTIETVTLFLSPTNSKSNMRAQLASSCRTTKPPRSCGRSALSITLSSGRTWPGLLSCPETEVIPGSRTTRPLPANWLTALCSLSFILAPWLLRRSREPCSLGLDPWIKPQCFCLLVRWSSKVLLTLSQQD